MMEADSSEMPQAPSPDTSLLEMTQAELLGRISRMQDEIDQSREMATRHAQVSRWMQSQLISLSMDMENLTCLLTASLTSEELGQQWVYEGKAPRHATAYECEDYDMDQYRWRIADLLPSVNAKLAWVVKAAGVKG
jgi:hypothetical protein